MLAIPAAAAAGIQVGAGTLRIRGAANRFTRESMSAKAGYLSMTHSAMTMEPGAAL